MLTFIWFILYKYGRRTSQASLVSQEIWTGLSRPDLLSSRPAVGLAGSARALYAVTLHPPLSVACVYLVGCLLARLTHTPIVNLPTSPPPAQKPPLAPDPSPEPTTL